MSSTTVANETFIGRDVPDEIAFPLMLARMMKKFVIADSGCWEWSGAIRNPGGYAWINFRGKQVPAHRLMHLLTKGPVPEGKDCCHTCDNRKCCNPDHLWIGSRQENLMDASRKGRIGCQQKTHCPKGHAYAEHGVRHGKNKWRKCTICVRARYRMRGGWSEDDAYSIGPIPQNAPTPRRWNKSAPSIQE